MQAVLSFCFLALLVVRPVRVAVADEIIDRVLAVAAGSLIMSLAFTEPSARFDAGGVETSYTRDGGDFASGCSATTAIQAANVPIPPTTAVIGMRRPRIRTLPGMRYGRSRSGSLMRSATIAACAVVNESIAPNE